MRPINSTVEKDQFAKAQKFFDDAKAAEKKRNDFFDNTKKDDSKPSPGIEKEMTRHNHEISELYRKAAEYVWQLACFHHHTLPVSVNVLPLKHHPRLGHVEVRPVIVCWDREDGINW